jgi:hypothetical protein
MKKHLHVFNDEAAPVMNGTVIRDLVRKLSHARHLECPPHGLEEGVD